MTGAAIRGAVLDHVAHAVPRWQDVWHRYAVDFGAQWASGGPGVGFAPAQLRFGNGARLEVLMPHDVEANDFLARFLAHSGPGPHHLTFKVPELDSALEAVRAGGFEPIGIDRSDPEWLEAFLHPKQATGVVVQLAQQAEPWSSPPPGDFPTGRRPHHDGTGPVAPALLERVTHVVGDLGAARSLFVGLLGGRVVDEGSSPGLHWSELAWDGPLGLRLVAPSGTSTGPLDEWLADRTGRIHHLELVSEDPEGIGGAQRLDPTSVGAETWPSRGDRWEIDPGANAGLRLVVHPPA
jgi:hypothetical protein